ncbi:hypothetical protein [Methanobrevibacter sp.]|uniref:hypothetical protein n=1 Tax=Methanobrevibacter sp. TaxID=66852 RepID=UPI00388DCC2F
MFKNCQKMTISKCFLISLACIVLIFTSFGIAMDGAYAVDLNQSAGEIESELNVEDKLGNSQEEILNSKIESEYELNAAQDNEILGSTISLLSGGTFSDIKKAVNNAKNGDTIKLKGTFVAEKAYDQINIDKKLTIMSDSSATLNAKGLTYILNIKTNAAGSTLKNLKFINGKRESNAGAVYINATGITVSNCLFKNNNAYQCGAIYSAYDNHSARNLLIQNCEFISNHAARAAGAIGVYGHNTRVINCTFDSNGVSNNIPNLNPYGGAIQIGMDDNTKGYVYDCKFFNNYVQPKGTDSHGGAGCVRNGIEYKNCLFVNNSAAQGGALTYHASGLIENCTFINNSAKYFGGALSTGYVDMDMDLFIQNCNFEGNEAPIGGAAQLIGKNIALEDCDFNSNHASQTGGAINIEANTVSIDKSTFNDNVANIDGGGIFVNGKNITISGSSFVSNDAIPDVEKLDDGLGGAIYINSTRASINNNEFYYNTARNGSAIYYDKTGSELKLTDNTLYQNQAWVYALPIYAHDIYYGETEKIGSIIHGGNNIAKYGNLSVSNAIYNAADNQYLEIDGETPVLGATTNGHLYQDDREYGMDILMTVTYEDGSVVYNKTLKSDVFGEVNDDLNNLKAGKYFVTAKHFEDTYYKAITNTTTFKVTSQADNKIKKTASSDEINFKDVVVWTLNVTNAGPSNATGIVIRDVLPEGLIYISDNSNGDYDPKTGTLTIDFLQVGEIYILTIQTRVNNTGNIVNDANVTANEYDYNLTNNHDDAGINVQSASDLAVVKSVNVSNVNMGDLVRWTITVTNNGPDVATGVICNDLLPESLIWQSDDSANKYDHNTGVWNIGTINKGVSVKLNIISKVNATGEIKNEVTVSGQQYDYDKSNNYDSEIIKVKPASDLGIVKLVGSSSVDFGDVVKWTLVVSNYGPDAASGVVVRDVLPKGFVYLNSSMPFADGVISIGDVAVGGSVSIDVYTRAGVTGSFVNVASVEGNEYDHNLVNNTANASIFVKPAADLSVEKSVNESNPNYHDLITWTVSVTNNGPDTATGVVVSDILPKSLIFISSDGNYDEHAGKWNIWSLNKGLSVKLNIVCRVNSTGMIENVVSVTGNEFDLNKSNNVDNEIISVGPASDLAVEKFVDRSTVNFTDVVKWTLVVSNYGPDAASGVVVRDVLPKGFVYLNSTKPFVNGAIELGNLAAGKTMSVDIFTRAEVTGTFVNVVSVEGNEYDPNLVNNNANASVLVNPASDLSVTKFVNNSNPDYNDKIKWTVTVTNNGPDTATGVVVQESLPESLVWIDDNGYGKYNHVSGVWDVGNLKNGESKSLIVTTLVNATGSFTNFVSVSGNEFDNNKSNNKDNKSVNVANASDLSVIKFANATYVDYHQFVKWTVIAHNAGPNKANGVTVEDILPEGLRLINYTATKGFYDEGIWNVCCIEVGDSQTLELICEVTRTGHIVNFARIEGLEYDPDKSNNNANSSVEVPLSSDLVVVKTVDNKYPNFGDIIEWSITLTNNGPDDAEDITVFDILNDGLELISYNATSGVYADGNWNVGYLKNGFSETLLLRCLVNTLDDVINVVEVIPPQYDWNKSNNRDSEEITPVPIADLSVIKFVDEETANYLDLVKWTLIVTNYGPNDATGVAVSDVIPKGLTIVETIGEGIYENSIWDIGDLANGESRQLDIVCKIQATGDFTNYASVMADQEDPDLENNDDECSLYVAPASDISITKTVSKLKYSVGDLVKYSVRLTNKGPDMAENVEVREIMDNSLKLKSFHASAGDFNKINDVWSLDELDVGETALLKIQAIATKEGSAENSVSATSDNYDPDLSNNDDEVSIKVIKKGNPITPNVHNTIKKYSKVSSKALSENILMKNKSGNPLMVLVVLFVFSFGAFCGRNIFKE